MYADWIARVLMRDIESLADQLEDYEDEADIWRLAPGVANSAGTLALHLAGNIQYYIGSLLAGTGYVRDRQAEFATRDLSRAQLLQQVDAARAALKQAISRIDSGTLDSAYPIEVAGTRLSTGQFLLHLAAHLAYHLGQVDYHRRLVTESGPVGGMQSIPALVADRRE